MRFLYEGILCSAYIFLQHKRLKQQVIQDRVVQWSTPSVVVFMAPHKSSSCLWLLPFPLYDNFKKPLPLCSSTPHKYNDYDKVTLIVSSNLFLFTCPPGHWFSMRFLPAEAYYCKKCVSQIHRPASVVNFSYNISIPQVGVNIKKIEHGTTFEIS